jgi:hypothetical protein
MRSEDLQSARVALGIGAQPNIGVPPGAKQLSSDGPLPELRGYLPCQGQTPKARVTSWRVLGWSLLHSTCGTLT